MYSCSPVQSTLKERLAELQELTTREDILLALIAARDQSKAVADPSPRISTADLEAQYLQGLPRLAEPRP